MKGKSVLKRILSFALSAAMAVTLMPAQMAQAAEGDAASAWPKRLAYFSFNESLTEGENAAAKIDGANASINKADTFNGAGGALELGGQTWLTLSKAGDENDNLITGKKELTISYWSKTTSEGSGSNTGWAWFASRNNETNGYPNEHYIGVIDAKGNYTVQRWNNSGRRKESINYEGTFNEWKMVTVVMAEDSTTLYIDGKQAARQTNEVMPLDGIVTAASKLMIGKANWGNGEFYRGLIDEFAIYDGVLSAEQVSHLYEKVESYDPISVETHEGVKPQLPDTVKVNFAGGTEGEEEIIWPEITPDQYALAGTVKVTGRLKYFDVEVEATVAVHALSEYLMASYTFDEDILADATGNKGNAAKENTVNAIDGLKGKAIQLPGGGTNRGSVKLPEDLLLKDGKVQDDFTISMYVKLANRQQHSTALLLHGDRKNEAWSSDNSTRNHIALYDRDSDRGGEDGLWVEYHTKQDQSSMLGKKDGSQTTADKWEHIAFVTKGSTGEAWLYKNGKLADYKDNITVKASDLAGRLNYLGATDWPDPDLAAAFDEFQVYDAVLDAGDIKKICDSGYRSCLAKAMEGLEIGYAEGDSAANVTSNITLPSALKAVDGVDVKVEWESSDPDVIGTDGLVDRLPEDKEVTLTATVSALDTSSGKGEILCSEKKEFKLTAAASSEVSFVRLDANIAKAEAVCKAAETEKAYTAESVDALKKLISDSKALKDKEGVTRDEVSGASKALEAAVTGSTALLKLKSLEQLNDVLAARYLLARNANDSTANQKNGAAKAKVTFHGSEGAALVKDTAASQTSVIDLPLDLFQSKDQLTISFWAKDTYSNRTQNHAVFGIGSGSSPSPSAADAFKYMLVNPTMNGGLKVVMSKENTYNNEKGFGNNNCAAPFEANVWIHVGLVFNGTSMAVYKNGVLAGETDTGITISDLGTLTNASIGNSIYGNNNGDKDFEGFVKNFRVYHASLAAEQVNSIYSQESLAVDKASLQDAIAQAEASMGEDDSKQDDYTIGSWNALKEAYAQAETVNADTTAIQEEADAAAAALKDAIEGLVSVKELRDAIAEAKSLEQGGYTDASWNAFQKAIEDAGLVLAKENPTEAEMKSAIQGINDARSKLTASNKAALTELIAEIRGMAGDYTAYSMAQLLSYAEELEESVPGNASAEEVNKAMADLRAAMEDLVSVKELKEAVANAREVQRYLSLYLADGKAEFADAYEYALEVLQNAQAGVNVGKAEITAACSHLDAARNGLYRRGDLSVKIKAANDRLSDEKYTTASKHDLEEAIKNAIQVNGDPDSTAADFRDAEERLESAAAKLVERADASELKALVDAMEALNASDYTGASWKAFQEVLDQSKEVLADDSSTAAALAAAKDALANAQAKLVSRATISELNSLYADIAGAAQLEASDYTSSSWAALQVAAANARAAAEGQAKAEVADCKSALQDAKGKLVNISALKTAIAEAGALAQADYTKATWADFSAKLEKANTTAANGSAAQGDVDTALTELNSAKGALVRISDLSELSSMIAGVSSLSEANYTVASWASFSQALAKANAVTQEMSQAEVDQAMSDLSKARDGLVRLADKTDLNARIAEMQAFTAGGNGQEGKYTSDTWKALEDALAAAQAVAGKENAADQEVADALQGLNGKFAALLARGDKTALNRHIADAEALDSTDYTAESWAALSAALAEAKAVQGEIDALQSRVNEKAAALRDAKVALEIATYDVVVDTANGVAAITEVIVAGQLISEPEEPERKGYTFAGWFAGETEFDFTQPILGDTVITAKWVSLPSVAGAKVQVAKAVYTGKAQKPEVTVVLDGRTLVETIDFTVKYSDNVKVGQGSAAITGIDGYTGSKVVKFNIVPSKVKNVKATNKKGRKAAVKFAKAAGVKGYRVTYSTDKNFKTAKNKNVTKNSITLSGLKKNKTYYVKVRAYTDINGKRVYGAYSSKVKVKIAK